jgi:hypothetical protein
MLLLGTLAVVCFALMVFMAMARRRRVLEETPSHTAYTNTTRYTPEGTPSNIRHRGFKKKFLQGQWVIFSNNVMCFNIIALKVERIFWFSKSNPVKTVFFNSQSV